MDHRCPKVLQWRESKSWSWACVSEILIWWFGYLKLKWVFLLQGVCTQLEGQHVWLRYLGYICISSLNCICVSLQFIDQIGMQPIQPLFFYKYERFCADGARAAACRFMSFTTLHVSVCSGTGCNYTVWQQSSRGWLTHKSELLVWDRHRSPASCHSSLMRTTSRTSNIHLDRFSCIFHWLLFTSNCEAVLGHYSFSK